MLRAGWALFPQQPQGGLHCTLRAGPAARQFHCDNDFGERLDATFNVIEVHAFSSEHFDPRVTVLRSLRRYWLSNAAGQCDKMQVCVYLQTFDYMQVSPYHLQCHILGTYGDTLLVVFETRLFRAKIGLSRSHALRELVNRFWLFPGENPIFGGLFLFFCISPIFSRIHQNYHM